jgi:hypothetical protein
LGEACNRSRGERCGLKRADEGGGEGKKSRSRRREGVVKVAMKDVSVGLHALPHSRHSVQLAARKCWQIT